MLDRHSHKTPSQYESLRLVYTLLTQDVVLTSFQRHLIVMDVRWTLKQRRVLTGYRHDVIRDLHREREEAKSKNITISIQ